MSLRIAAQRHQSYGSISTVAQKRAGNAGGDADSDDGLNDRETTGLLDGEEVGGIAGVAQEGKRVIGVFSAVFIILNRMIGTAVFATPSTILVQSGSVGLSLLMWIFGGVFAYLGMHVYIIWGSAFPRSGGEKNYLEYMFPRPKFLSTSVYAAFGTLLAYSAGNSLVFGEYFLKALSFTPTPLALKLTGFGCITFTMLLHGSMVTLGLRIQNLLGMFKIIVLLIVIGSGLAAYLGHLEMEAGAGSQTPFQRNFEHPFEGTTSNLSSFCLGLYNALWGYAGFSNVNYALSEVKNPARTIKIAGPVAIVLVAALYILANVAYFAAATKEEITGSGRLVAALLFRNVWGAWTERVLSAFVAFSALGNVMSVMFSQARVNQELGREGILPFSRFWASSVPFNAPLTGLSLHWALCTILIFTISAGDAYEFVINIISYPLAIINAVISFGIIYLSSPSLSPPSPHWPRVSPASQLAALTFGLLNTFLFLVPLLPPPKGSEPYESLPYWVHAVGGWAVFGVGAVYWVVWARLGPWWGGYRVEREDVVGEDGIRRGVFRRVGKGRVD